MLNLPITATKREDIVAELNKLIDQLLGADAGTMAAASFQTLSANPFNLIDKLTGRRPNGCTERGGKIIRPNG
ncbi:hypothetical protein M8494_20730 [Serratia ureilytica]